MRVGLRKTDGTRSVTRGFGMFLAQEKHAMGNISASRNGAQRRRTVEPTIDPTTTMTTQGAGLIAVECFTVRTDEPPGSRHSTTVRASGSISNGR